MGNSPQGSKAARSVWVKFTNETDYTIKETSFGLHHGIWTHSSPSEIKSNSSKTWQTESSGFMTGTEGYASYKIDGKTFRITWNNPYAGGNSYYCSSPTGFNVSYSGGHGDNADVYFKITKPTVKNIDKATMLIVASRGSSVGGKSKSPGKYAHQFKTGGSGGLNVEFDINVVMGKIAAAKSSKVKLYVLNGEGETTEEEAKTIISKFLQSNNSDCIYYTGHGDTDGDWCFANGGYISFEWFYDKLKQYKSGKKFYVHCDACYSGNWPLKLVKKDKSITRKWCMASACGSDVCAYDNEYSEAHFGMLGDWLQEQLGKHLANNGGIHFRDGEICSLNYRPNIYSGSYYVVEY
eukprot:218157_1